MADRARITFANGFYSVPSQSGGHAHTVIIDDHDAACDCADFELRGKACKHILAVKLFVRRQARGAEQDKSDRQPSPKPPRKTYPQSWSEYNAAQVNEQGHFTDLLAELCRGAAGRLMGTVGVAV